MAAEKQLTEERGDKRLKDAEVQRQNEAQLCRNQHNDSLDRTEKRYQETVKRIEDSKEDIIKSQKELDQENNIKTKDERERLQSLYENTMKVMNESKEYERQQKDREIADNKEHYETARDREVVLYKLMVQRADDERKRELEREQNANMNMLRSVNDSLSYERQRNRAVGDSLFSLTALQILHGSKSTYCSQGYGQQLVGRQCAQPFADPVENQPARIAPQIPHPGQVDQPMYYPINFGQPATSNPRAQSAYEKPGPGQIVQPVDYPVNFGQPAASNPRASIAYQKPGPGQIEQPVDYPVNFGQPATSNPRASIAYQKPGPGQIEQPVDYPVNFGQPATSNPRAPIAYHMPGPSQIEQQIQYAGNFGQPSPSNHRAQIAYQMPGPSQIEQQIQYAGNFGQPSPSNHRAQIAYQMPGPVQMVQPMQYDYDFRQPTAFTKLIQQQIPAPAQIKQQFSIAGQHMTTEIPTVNTIADLTGQRISTAEHYQQCAPLPVQQPFPNTGGVGSLIADPPAQRAVNENGATETVAIDVRPPNSVNQDYHTSSPLDDHIQMANSELDTEAGEPHIPENLPEAELGVQHLSLLENV